MLKSKAPGKSNCYRFPRVLFFSTVLMDLSSFSSLGSLAAVRRPPSPTGARKDQHTAGEDRPPETRALSGRQAPSLRGSGKRDSPAAPLPPSHPPPGTPPPAKVPYSSWREEPLSGGGFVFKEHAEGSGLACHQSGSIRPAPGT